MKKFVYFVLFLIISFIFTACSDTNDNNENLLADGIKWDNEPDGTLEVQNNSLNDIVLFHGQILTVSSILGGIRKSSAKTFDISAFVDDFATGGYMIVRGLTIDEYNKNKSNLTNAKIEYTAMVLYRKGTRFKTEINPAYLGGYCFKVNNTSRIGIELRKNNLDGERINYIPPMAYNYTIYTNSAEIITVFPVYIIYNKLTKTITYFKSNANEESVTVSPKPLTDTSAAVYSFPVNPGNLQELINTYTYLAAFIKCTNNVPNQASRLQLGGTIFTSENGNGVISSGETLVFGLAATGEGQEMNLIMTLLNGTISVPVKQNGNTPILKNGYIYNLSLNYIGGGSGLYESANYSAVINAGSKLDIYGEIIP